MSYAAINSGSGVPENSGSPMALPGGLPGWAAALAAAFVGCAWVVFAAFGAIPGVFTIDGLTYLAMIDAFAHEGSLFVTNGPGEFASDSLLLELLIDVPGGRLAPQYPGGWGIVAAPAYLAGGIRGVIVMNAVASALTLPLIWLAARALFEDRRLAANAVLIYAFASFAIDYAAGFWPHGVTTFLVTAALASAAVGWRAGGTGEMRGMALAGLVLGLGVNVRVDALFAAAPLAAWMLGAGRRPYAGVAALIAGLVPGLVVAAAINQVKFGIPSPVTYGRGAGGGTSLGFYVTLLPLMGAAALGVLALGSVRVRAVVYRPAGLVLAAAAIAGVVLAVPALRGVAWRILQGFYVLGVDFQAIPTPGRGLEVQPDGTIRAFGLIKKALLQSLPYAAAALVLLPGLARGRDRAGLALCTLFVFVIAAPFAFSWWHGGLSGNMRYFLNLVPAVAILAAAAWREIAAVPARDAPISTIAAALVLTAALSLGLVRGYAPNFVLQVSLPNAVVSGLAAVSVVFLITGIAARGGAVHGIAAAAMRGLFVLGLGTAFFSAWVHDLQTNQSRRAVNATMTLYSANLPPDALVFTFVASYAGFRLNQPEAMTSKADFGARSFDAGLAAWAFAEGRPVFAQSRVLAELMLEQGAAVRAVPRYGLHENLEFYELTPPGGAPDGKAGGTE